MTGLGVNTGPITAKQVLSSTVTPRLQGWTRQHHSTPDFSKPST